MPFLFGKGILVAGLIAVPFCAQATCSWETIARRYDVDQGILQSIEKKESSGNPRALNINTDGSRDVGALQINSQHFPLLKSYGISEKDLYRPCRSREVGAWVLAHCQRIFGKTWEAVGCYNAGTSKKDKARAARLDYALRVKSIYTKNFSIPKS